MSIANRFRCADLKAYPDIRTLERCLDRALWVLLVGKDVLATPRLTAREIAEVLVEFAEISVTQNAVMMALNRAGNKVHVRKRSRDDGATTYEVMNKGREHLMEPGPSTVDALYFTAGQKYTSKRVLADEVLATLKGTIRVVDTYCGPRTLDLLRQTIRHRVKLLTVLANLSTAADQATLKREINDYKAEFRGAEFRDNQSRDLHDRYVVADDALVLLGHGIKDLGNKESFVIVLPKATCPDLYVAVLSSFDQRWRNALPL
jgi:hypothetical protein